MDSRAGDVVSLVFSRIKEFVVAEVLPHRRRDAEPPMPAPRVSSGRGNRAREPATETTTVAPVGHRQWALVPTPGPTEAEPIPVLAGPITRQVWWQPEIEATCNRGFTHASPDLECTCGIHAMKEPLRKVDRQPMVCGPVALSGLVVECQYGFRATTARIAGSLEIVIPCAMTNDGRPSRFRTCNEPIEVVALVGDAFVGGCRDHPVTSPVTWTPATFTEYVHQWFKARYDTETKGHRG